MPALSERDMRVLAFERGTWRTAGREGAGHRRCARLHRDEVLPAAQRADRQPGGAEVRPGARQAAAGAAGPPPAHTFAAPGYQVAVPLPRASTPDGQAGLAAMAADPAHALFATDYDGTLAPIVDDPAKAVAAPGAVAALARLAGRVGTVAVITGRAAADAVALGGLADVPGLIVLGHYGAQRWQAGVLSDARRAPRRPGRARGAARAARRSWARPREPPWKTRAPRSPCTPGGRRIPPRRSRCCASRSASSRTAPRSRWSPAGWCLSCGRRGWTRAPRCAGLPRNAAPARRRSAATTSGTSAAFAAIRQLRAEGIPGCAVASASAETPQVAEAADLVVDGPHGIVPFLADTRAAAACRGPAGSDRRCA